MRPTLDGINLTLGENQIKDSALKVNLADYNDPNLFRITPINFTSSMQTDFNFKYIFKNEETKMNYSFLSNNGYVTIINFLKIGPVFCPY